MKIGKYPTSIGAVIIHTTDEDMLYTVGFSETYVVATGNTSPISRVVDRVISAIERGQEYDLSFDLRGTDFQREVWAALRKIPSGQTRSYQDIAIQIGAPKSFRAVANAIGRNPIAVIIPCHRVIRSNGDLGGYHWGTSLKKKLLERESAVLIK